MKLFSDNQIIVNEAIKGWGVSIAGRSEVVHVYKWRDVDLLVKCLKFGKLPSGNTGYYTRHCLKQLLTGEEYKMLGAGKSKQRYNNDSRRKHA